MGMFVAMSAVCPTCRVPTSTTAAVCPNCWRPIPKLKPRKGGAKTFRCLLQCLGVFVFGLYFGDEPTSIVVLWAGIGILAVGLRLFVVGRFRD
jgi:hypothetical protein